MARQSGSRSTELINKAALCHHELFADIPENLAKELIDELDVKTLEKGSVLIECGEKNQTLYLLVSGTLSVHLDSKDAESNIFIESGECIGEMSIIEETVTSAWVVAKTPCIILSMTQNVFWERYMRLEGAVKGLLKTLVSRMRNNNKLIQKSIEEKLRLEHLKKELSAATHIQENILVSREQLFPNHPQVEADTLFEPAKEVGGDFYEAFPIDDEHIAIAIGDVSDKGMPAALFMIRVLTALRMSLPSNEISAIMPSVNKMSCENNEELMFATMFIAILNVKTGLLKYVNAGHNPPFMAKKDKPFEMMAINEGIMVGIFDDAEYCVEELKMEEGDTLILYTDGVTEAENAKQDQFEEKATQKALNACPSNRCSDLVKALRTDIKAFTKDHTQNDDITILALKYLS